MTTDPYLPTGGDASYRVREYRLKLRYRMATNRLDGEAVILATANVDLDEVRLDLVGLQAAKVRFDRNKRTRFRQGPQGLAVATGERVSAGQEFEVAIRYSGSPAPRSTRWGRLGWEELADGVLVASQPNGAPTWFPCNDWPGDKATYQIEFTAEDAYQVAGTGDLVGQEFSSGRCTWTFRQSLPTATYLMGVQIGRFRTAPLALGSIPGTVFYPAGRGEQVQADLAKLPTMLNLFEELFGPYPMGRYDVVVTPDELEIPLESQGQAVFGANHLAGEGQYERLVAHELAHQWFGNSVGLRRWRDIWLNEGFCCYAEWLWAEAAGGPTCQQQARSFRSKLADQPQDLILSDPGAERMFDDRVYKRGALTLHALRNVAGDELFFQVLRAWSREHQHSTATTEEFIATAERVTGHRLASLLADWLERPELPKLPVRSTRG